MPQGTRNTPGASELKRLALAFLLLFAATPAFAQDWPTKTVRIVVPFGAGATPDTIARLIADKLQQKLGQTFIVENKPGASGMTGTDTVAKAEPDGYTIGVSIGGPLAINTLLFSKMPYDPFKDVALITMLTTQPSALAVPANFGVNSVAELVALIKKEPSKYNFGSIGNGSLSHLAMEAIALKSDAKLTHIPYGSSPQAMTARDPWRRADGGDAGDLGAAARAAGHGEDACGDDGEALPAPAQRADLEGKRHRRRSRRLERLDCAGRDAARDPGEDPPRSCRGHHLVRAARKIRRADHGAGRQHSGRVQDADRLAIWRAGRR